MLRFKNAQEAFEHYYDLISCNGLIKSSSFYLNNIGFYIDNPLDNCINTPWRKWSRSYADIEWKWYLSKNRSVEHLKKHAKIWDNMHNGDNIVNSNYGWQWSRNEQLQHVVNLLKENPESRQAVITIYDGKEHETYSKDTPCTLNIYFSIENNKLNMSVLMRSNDLWFGFCNDQYCFSLLQKEVAKFLNLPLGWYFHFANDLHLYKNKLGKNPHFINS
jgi:thymidylate synthase